MSDYKTYEVRVYTDGDKSWFLNGKLHREDGPAIEYANGDKYWYLNGKLHREDGPAVECTNGSKLWYINGKRHREDGPAIECTNGDKSWCLNDVWFSKEEFLAKTKTTTCENKVVEIDGKKYKLTAV